MDLETENRIAAILLKEAAELRRQAEREGIHAYLRKPEVRGRPNSRFLTATVLGVQQANKAVEVNEMWRVRSKELELDQRLKCMSTEESSSRRRGGDMRGTASISSKGHVGNDDNAICSSLSNRRTGERFSPREDDGLRDEEIEEFLHSRVKRGRGSVGSRMDETGPYLPASSDTLGKQSTSQDVGGTRVLLGPERPAELSRSTSSISDNSSSSDEEEREHSRKKARKDRSKKLERKHSHKRNSNRKSKDDRKRKDKKDKKRKRKSER